MMAGSTPNQPSPQVETPVYPWALYGYLAWNQTAHQQHATSTLNLPLASILSLAPPSQTRRSSLRKTLADHVSKSCIQTVEIRRRASESLASKPEYYHQWCTSPPGWNPRSAIHPPANHRDVVSASMSSAPYCKRAEGLGSHHVSLQTTKATGL